MQFYNKDKFPIGEYESLIPQTCTSETDLYAQYIEGLRSLVK